MPTASPTAVGIMASEVPFVCDVADMQNYSGCLPVVFDGGCNSTLSDITYSVLSSLAVIDAGDVNVKSADVLGQSSDLPLLAEDEPMAQLNMGYENADNFLFNDFQPTFSTLQCGYSGAQNSASTVSPKMPRKRSRNVTE